MMESLKHPCHLGALDTSDKGDTNTCLSNLPEE
jgi:hypothetical protein